MVLSREEESRKGDMKEGGEWYCQCVRQREEKRDVKRERKRNRWKEMERVDER